MPERAKENEMPEVVTVPPGTIIKASPAKIEVLPPKPFVKSMTIIGASAGFIGVVDLLVQIWVAHPEIAAMLSSSMQAIVASLLALVGPVIAIFGRLRPGSGAPLTVGEQKERREGRDIKPTPVWPRQQPPLEDKPLVTIDPQ